jgi:hypothetical protein
MKSRREFVNSQGWGTSSELRALARIQVLQRRETRQVNATFDGVDTDDANVNYGADEIGESTARL